MKICIIGHTEKNYLPFMERYEAFFKENDIEYDIICWQREEELTGCPKNEYHFFEEMDENFFNKVASYLRFRRFVLKVLKKNKYDKLVILTTVPAIFLSGYLFSHYEGRYLFDFRDYSFEKFGFYRKKVNKLVDRSALTTISSHGFMDFLAENKKITMNHNIPPIANKAGTAPDLKDKQVLNIGFIGGVRYFDENCFLISKLKNEFRYQLWYIGKPIADCNLQGFCAEQGITNVSFVGKYNNSDKVELYKNIDMINSIYGNDSLEVTTALPNRLYEACLLKKPIISSKGTFLGEIIDRYKIGISVDVETDDVLAMIDNYVDNFNPKAFTANCEEFLKDVSKDEETLYRHLKAFIKAPKAKKKGNKGEEDIAKDALDEIPDEKTAEADVSTVDEALTEAPVEEAPPADEPVVAEENDAGENTN